MTTSPDAEDRATTNGYPQINLNTGLSFAVLVVFGGLFAWLFGIKGDVSQTQQALSYHESRIVSLESSTKEMATSINTTRYAQAQSEIKLEGRLVGIEGLLRDVINRLAMAERDRRGGRPEP